MKRITMKYVMIVICTLICSLGKSQTKNINAVRINEAITIDGVLDDPAWSHAESATGFTTIEPAFLDTATVQPVVKMVYDDNQVYFGIFIPANSPDEIRKPLSKRDDTANADWIGIILDTYGQGTGTFQFIVTAAGVQIDVTEGRGAPDENWDAVWQSDVSIAINGWFAEVAVPYSAIRFPNQDVQTWKANFIHRSVVNGEKTTFYPIDPEVPGFINQSATVSGVEKIKSPLRLALTPYFTSYYTTNKDTDGNFSDGFNVSGGLDLKYGINDAFTLDMTLVPDFGQVRADDNVLNLSPFEIQFSENRQFFTEGVELFNKANIFYTRRIGSRPIGFYDIDDNIDDTDEVINNPINSRLVNASKVSGRTKGGWGIGLLNAVARKEYAEVRNEQGDIRQVQTSPLTNYNVAVIDKNLPNSSYVSLINTNVTRFDSDYHNANVTAGEANLRLFDENIGSRTVIAVSQLQNKNATNTNGVKFSTRLKKISGKFNYGINVAGTSKTYDNNDLGFNAQTNVMSYGINSNYQFTDGFWKFAFLNTWVGYSLFTRFDDQKVIGQNYNAGFWGRTNERWELNLWMNYNPSGFNQFKARKDGQLMEELADANAGMYIGTDDRKRFTLGIFWNVLIGQGKRYNSFNIGFDPQWIVSDRLTVSLGTDYTISRGSRNYVDDIDDVVIIGLRDRLTNINSLRLNYTVNKNISISSRLRHYWTKVEHTKYFDLQTDASLLPSNYNEDQAYTYNGLNMNTEFRWRFAPGSDIIAVWQNNISGSEDIDLDGPKVTYIQGVKSLRDLSQNNSFSIRILYYLDVAKWL